MISIICRNAMAPPPSPSLLPARMKARYALPQLAEGYVPYTFDYEEALPDGTPGRKAWVGIFRKAIPQFKRRAELQMLEDAMTDLDAETAGERAKRFADEYTKVLDAFEHSEDTLYVPPGFEIETARRGNRIGLNCKVLCAIRETCLARQGLRDAFRHVKVKENKAALKVLPSVIEELDRHDSAHER